MFAISRVCEIQIVSEICIAENTGIQTYMQLEKGAHEVFVMPFLCLLHVRGHHFLEQMFVLARAEGKKKSARS